MRWCYFEVGGLAAAMKYKSCNMIQIQLLVILREEADESCDALFVIKPCFNNLNICQLRKH